MDRIDQLANGIAPAPASDGGNPASGNADRIDRLAMAIDEASPGIGATVLQETGGVAKELLQTVPRALSQTLTGAASTFYRGVGAGAELLGADPTPYIRSAQASDILREKAEELFAPSQAAQERPLGPAGIVRNVGPSIAQSATAFISPALALGLIGTTTAGSSAADYDQLLREKYPDLTEGERNRAAIGLGVVNAAAQTAIEKFAPFQRLARGQGPAYAKSLLGKLAWAASTGAGTEGAQQVVEEALKVGLNPESDQVKQAVQSVLLSAYYGAFGEGAAPLVQIGVERATGRTTAPGYAPIDERPGNLPETLTTDEPAVAVQPESPAPETGAAVEDVLPLPTNVVSGVATAQDLQQYDELQQALTPPTPPPALASYTPVDRSTKQPLSFASDYEKAKYIAENPAYRGKKKAAISEYVKKYERHLAAVRALSTPSTVAAPSAPSTPASTASSSSVPSRPLATPSTPSSAVASTSSPTAVSTPSSTVTNVSTSTVTNTPSSTVTGVPSSTATGTPPSTVTNTPSSTATNVPPAAAGTRSPSVATDNAPIATVSGNPPTPPVSGQRQTQVPDSLGSRLQERFQRSTQALKTGVQDLLTTRYTTAPDPVRVATALNTIRNAYARSLRLGQEPRTEEQARVKDVFASRGIHIEYFVGSTNVGARTFGFVIKDTPGVIFLNADITMDANTLRVTLLHEFAHLLDNYYPEFWTRIEQAAPPEAVARARREAKEAVKPLRRISAVRPAQWWDEYEANEARAILFEHLAENPRVIEALEGREPTVWGRIKELWQHFLRVWSGTNDPLVDEAVRTLRQFGRQPIRLTRPKPAKLPVPNPDVQQIARDYASRALGNYEPDTTYVSVDPKRARLIAQWYENAAHDPSSPRVRASYAALIKETVAQYNAIIKAGYKIEPWTGEGSAYKSSAEMMADVKNNRHLYYDPTDRTGFGSTDETNHPMMVPVTLEDGKTVLANDVFRAVHDFFGHAKEGYGFGPRGEENAWRQHSQMYSALARPAMTAETRGQNSWVNYGPYGEQNRKNPAKTVYAPQKAVLAPDWVVNDTLLQAKAELATFPKTPYGYWVTPDGRVVTVPPAGHNDVAHDLGLKNTLNAIEQGGIRVVDEGGIVEVEVLATNHDKLERVRPLVRNALADRRGVSITLLGEEPVFIPPETRPQTGAIIFDQVVRGEFERAQEGARTLINLQFATEAPFRPVPSLTPAQRLVEPVVQDTVPDLPRNVIRNAREQMLGQMAEIGARSRDVLYRFDRAIRSAYGVPYNKLPERERLKLRIVLDGEKGIRLEVPDEVRSIIGEMREMIDSLSTELAEQLKLTSPELAEVIESRRGVYVNRSYRIFEDAEKQIDAVMSGKGVYATIRADYEQWVRERAQESGVDLSQAEVEGLMRRILEAIVGEGRFGPALAGLGLEIPVSGRRPIGILKPRKKVPYALRAALGENLDPGIVFPLTTAKQIALVAATQFQNAVADAGAGKWLFRQPTGVFTRKIVADDPNNPLNGFYTSPEIARHFIEYRQAPALLNSALVRWWMRANAVARLSVTVGSTAAAGANYIGQVGFLLATGIVSPRRLLSVFVPGRAQAMAEIESLPLVRRALESLLGRLDASPAVRDQIAEYTRNGLLNDSVFGRDVVEAARELNLDSIELLSPSLLKKWARVPLRTMVSVYNLSDTRARLLIYEEAKKELQRAYPDWTVEQVEKEAADRAKNTYMSHMRAWNWAKQIARAGFVGPFAVFSAEMLRTQINNMVYGLTDMTTGFRRWSAGEQGGYSQLLWGLRRYTGTVALIAGLSSLSGVMSQMFGDLDDEDEKKARKMLPWWLRYATGFFVKDDEGTYRFINLSRYVPFLMISDISRAFSDGGALAGLKQATVPVVGEQLFTARVVDVLRNTTSDGRPVYNPAEADEVKKGEDIARHLLAPFVPDVVRRPLTRIIPALRGAEDVRGQPLDPGDEMLKAAGITITTLEPLSRIGAQAVAHRVRVRDATMIFTSALRTLNTPDEEDILDAYRRAEESRFKVWQDTYDIVTIARKAGKSDRDIREMLRMGVGRTTDPAGISANEVGELMAGRYVPYDFRANERYQFAYRHYRDKVPQGKMLDFAAEMRRRRLDQSTNP